MQEATHTEAGLPQRLLEAPYLPVRYQREVTATYAQVLQYLQRQDPFAKIRHLVRELAFFWLRLARCVAELGPGVDPWFVAECDRAQRTPDTDDALSGDNTLANVRDLAEICGILQIEVSATAPREHSGDFLHARLHARRQQAVEAMRAAEHALELALEDAVLLTNCPDGVATETFEEQREEVLQQVRVLEYDVYRVGFGALWLWKAHARQRNDGENGASDSDEIRFVWSTALTLRALTLRYLEDDGGAYARLTLADFVGVFRPDHPVLRHRDGALATQPIAAYTLDALWRALVHVCVLSPTLTAGEDLAVLLDLLWLRTATLARVAGPRELMDCRAMVQIADANTPGHPRFSVSDRFLVETESIFYCFCDTVWVLRWLRRTQRVPGLTADDESWFDAERLPPPRAPPDAVHVWHEVVKKMLTSNAQGLLKLDYDKRIWPRFMQWEQHERYMRENFAIVYTPEVVINMYKRPRFDAITQNCIDVLLTRVWPHSAKQAQQDHAERERVVQTRVAVPSVLAQYAPPHARGWCWAAEWDLKRDLDRAQRRTHGGGSSVIINEDLVQINSHYRWAVAALQHDDRTLPVGHTTLNAIEMSAGYCVLNKTSAGITDTKILVENGEINARQPPLTLLAVCQREREDWFRDGFSIHIHAGHFVVFDGVAAHGLAGSFIDALFCWVHAVEHRVCRHLNTLAVQLITRYREAGSDRELRQMHVIQALEAARVHVSAVPRELRVVFGLERDPQYHYARYVRTSLDFWQSTRLDAYLRGTTTDDRDGAGGGDTMEIVPEEHVGLGSGGGWLQR